MWHEARKQERAIRQVIVDYRKRAERKHDYYEKVKQDPTKFMQIHGCKAKINIDENGLLSDNQLSMMPWQGDKSNMIDRFDVRAHLDFIQDVKNTPKIDVTTDKEERKINYERYRVLVYNQHKNISEQQHLKSIFINESYPDAANSTKQEQEAKKQLLSASKAKIGFQYEEGSVHKGKSDVKNYESDAAEDGGSLLRITIFLSQLFPNCKLIKAGHIVQYFHFLLGFRDGNLIIFDCKR